MDKLLNPFSPGAGTQPPELAGRATVLEQALLALARVKSGRFEKSVLLIGLRGVGKTVLLNRIHELAGEQGYQSIMIEAREDRSLPKILIPALRQILLRLDRGMMVSEKVKRGLAVLKSFMNGVRLSINEVEISLEVEPETGVADSGDLEADLSELLVALGEAAQDRGTAIAIIIDELQILSATELSSLIMAMHKIAQRTLPVILIGAGLPQLVANTGNSKTYSERLFNFMEIGPLNEDDAKSALQEPVKHQNVEFTAKALTEIILVTQGYPYFLQEWGYQCWNLATISPITESDAQNATKEVIPKMDKSFFRVRFDRLTPREKDYLRAMAELGAEPQRSGDIAHLLGVDSRKVATLRDGLIRKGMIYSPAHGNTAFTVPLFDEFMRRIMPASPEAAVPEL